MDPAHQAKRAKLSSGVQKQVITVELNHSEFRSELAGNQITGLEEEFLAVGSTDHLSVKARGARQCHKKACDIIVRSISPIEHIAGVFIRLQLFLLVLLLCASAFIAEVPGSLRAR